jgi:hypothetical protein
MLDHRDLVHWSAFTCELDGAGVFLGIAPGLEDERIARAFTPDQVGNHGRSTIELADASSKLPLRLLAVRDRAIVRVEPLAEPSGEEGFERASLWWDLSKGVAGPRPPAPAAPVPNVVAFMLTIGFPRASEEVFFRDRVPVFLKRSWGRFPRLLREAGCAKPEKPPTRAAG